MRSPYIIGGLVVIIILIVFFVIFDPTFFNPETFKSFLESSRGVAPILIILIIVVEVLVAPLPGGTVPVAAGFILGNFKGALYSWIGNIIGASLAFLLARKFGRPFVEKLVKKERLEFYDSFLKQNSFLLWIVYLVPLFPVDVVSFAAGVAKLPFKKYFTVMSLAFIPNMLFLSYFGERLYRFQLKEIFTLFLPLVAIFLIIIYFINYKKRKK